MFETVGPYARALGTAVDELHPRLRAYFAGVPDGHVGIGSGTFSTVGTPRRWLRPLFALFERWGVVPTGWAQDVPFDIRNRTEDGRTIGERVFHLPGRAFVMNDAVSVATAERIVDHLGDPKRVAGLFAVTVEHGGLHLHSIRTGLRFGPLRLRIPAALSPRIHLVESFDDARDCQHVSFTMDLPLLGRIHEYTGTFAYRIIREDAA